MQLDLVRLMNEGADSAIHAPVNRVGTRFYGQVYPVADRPVGAPEPELPPAFADLPGRIGRDLPFHAALQAAKTREELYGAYEGALVTVAKLYAENAEFLQDVFKANVEVRADWATDRRKFDLMQQKVQEWTHRLPRFEFERPRLLGLDLHRRPEFVVRATLEAGVRDGLHTLVKKLLQGLDCMVELEQVGLIEWVQDDGCRFHFYRNVVVEEAGEARQTTEEVTDRRERKRTVRTERDVTRTHRHARHVHEVVCAKNYLLAAAGHVPTPDRARKLLADAPAYLKPAMRVVTGYETRRLVIERDLATESLTDAEEAVTVEQQFVYRPDPAVVIGHYVLTGWGQEEVAGQPPEPPAIAAPNQPMLPPKGGAR